ncbi:MAG: hypothetical protein AAF432_08445 [Planctomycetota bacterium]
MLTKTQVIARIQTLNATADGTWLDQFSSDALRQYLAHLEVAREPRGSVWRRSGDSPAVMTRRPAA